jgi:hypothetical protein
MSHAENINYGMIFGQIPHPVVSVTKDGSMGLLIK